MNILLFLYFIIPLSPNYQDKQYSHKDVVCSYSYTVTKQWNLNLKGQGTFNLKFSKKDTRYKKETESDFLGTWVNKNDTIILTVSAPLPNDCGFRNASYILSKDTLKSLMIGNICLPVVLEPIKIGL